MKWIPDARPGQRCWSDYGQRGVRNIGMDWSVNRESDPAHVRQILPVAAFKHPINGAAQ
jgi:hypothetical protein